MKHLFTLTILFHTLFIYNSLAWRDLETGAYFTRDPAGFVDGPNMYTYVRQNPWTYIDPLGLEIDDQTHRVEEREIEEPGDAPDKASFERETDYTAARNEWRKKKYKVKEDKKWNEDHRNQIQAWKNYDKAVNLLRKTEEGEELLRILEDSKAIFRIEIGASLSIEGGENSIRTGPTVKGEAAYLGVEDGKRIYGTIMRKDVMLRTRHGVDSEAYGVTWEELYHHLDNAEAKNSIDAAKKFRFPTHSSHDVRTKEGKKSFVPYAHERRATRFQNIIRYRNEGKRIDHIYGNGTTDIPEPLGGINVDKN